MMVIFKIKHASVFTTFKSVLDHFKLSSSDWNEIIPAFLTNKTN